MNITLYYAPTACSLVPYVTLTEAGAPFTVEKVNLRTQQQMSADYLKLNPKHKVPVLVVDGKTLTENIAIQQFIARSFPAAKLLPSDPWAELQAISLMSWCAAGIHPFLSRINAPISSRSMSLSPPRASRSTRSTRISRFSTESSLAMITSSIISRRSMPTSTGASGARCSSA